MLRFKSGLMAILLSLSGAAWAETIKLTTPKLGSMEQMVLSIQHHFPRIAAKYNIPYKDVEVIYTRGSVEALQNLMQGRTHMNIASLPAVVSLHAKSPGQLQFLSMFVRSDGPLVCKPYVKDIQDIKTNNRSIIIAGKQSGSHLTIMSIGKKYFNNTMALESQIMLMGQEQALQAFATGTKGVDCAIMGAPISNQLVEMGNKVLYNDESLPGFLSAAVINAQWAKENPRAAEALLETIKVARDEYNNNMLVTARRMVEAHKLTLEPETIVRYYRERNIRGFTQFNTETMNWLRFTEEVGMMPPGSMDSFNKGLIWRKDLL
jgi:ABC-type nitrate/sulfonate/bicarbonate transport system substrate-binding protein